LEFGVLTGLLSAATVLLHHQWGNFRLSIFHLTEKSKSFLGTSSLLAAAQLDMRNAFMST
jgi:hypothetical protein